MKDVTKASIRLMGYIMAAAMFLTLSEVGPHRLLGSEDAWLLGYEPYLFFGLFVACVGAAAQETSWIRMDRAIRRMSGVLSQR